MHSRNEAQRRMPHLFARFPSCKGEVWETLEGHGNHLVCTAPPLRPTGDKYSLTAVGTGVGYDI